MTIHSTGKDKLKDGHSWYQCPTTTGYAMQLVEEVKCREFFTL